MTQFFRYNPSRMPTRLIELVENLPKSRVVLVGDLMLDRYLHGNVERLSPEAPVPVLHFEREELRLGGAGNVAANLAMLGGRVCMVATVGDDDMGRAARRHFADFGIDGEGLIEVPGRPTVAKMRLVGAAQHRHAQTMMRLDFEDPSPVDAATAERICAAVEARLGQAEVLCIEDYKKGLLTPAVCQRLIASAKQRGVPVIIDPANIADYERYHGATAIKLNRPEAERATGLDASSSPDQYPLVA